MRLRLKYKLFLILFAASMITITSMFCMNYLSFKSGLIRFMGKVEMRRLDIISSILEEAYTQEGNWDFLRRHPEALYRLQAYMFEQWRQNRKGDGPHPVPTDSFRPEGEYGSRRSELFKNRWKNARRHDFTKDIVLLDRDKTPVLPGMMKPDGLKLTPITVDDNTVGYVGMVPPESITTGEELLFFKQQARMFFIIAIAVMALSVIIAVWSAYYLEGPIRALTTGTRKLTSGEYSVEIPVNSGDELGQLSRDFNTLARTLEESERGRKQWVADIAHDLRTPLTLLSGEIEAIEDGLRELTPDTLKRLRNDISYLIRLVNDLGELSRTDLGALSYKKEKIDLVDVLNRSMEAFREPFSAKKFSLDENVRGHSPIFIFADVERLGRLFGNIFQNSLHYTDSDGQIEIRIGCFGENVVVTVEDSAPGVPASAIPKLFDRLYRVDPARNHDHGASGLGLAICKNIVAAHGGNISASPSPLGGLRICIELPVNA